MMIRIAALLGAKKPQNNEAAVLNAGWTALQKADPNLANAVKQMPPELARGVVFQYTNAVRQGNDADASTAAMNFAREQLAAMSQNNQQQQAPGGLIGMRLGGILGRSSGGSSAGPRVTSVDAFEQALSGKLQAPAPRPLFSGGNPRNTMFAKFFQRLREGPAPKSPQDALEKVRSQYQAFNQANWTEYDKNLLWDRPADRELKAPDTWKPSGLVASNMNQNTNPFGGY
jgi:hypothetical protein